MITCLDHVITYTISFKTMSTISTKNLCGLPSVDGLSQLLQSLATLDAIISLDDGGAYYSYQSRWAKNQQVGQMHNGSGDDFHAYFNRHGCFLKGFAHESTMSPYQFNPRRIWPGILDKVPPAFDSALSEPAFSMPETTFAIWRLNDDDGWQCGDIEYPNDGAFGDGSEEMLSILDGDPDSYVGWATEYFETDISVDSVQHIYLQRPLDNDFVKSLNPEATVGKLHNCLVQIGYPGISSS